MPLPKFVCIGAPRCGTRWMSQCLSEHPQIAVPKDEVYFFTTRRVVNSSWHKGIEWYSNIFESIIGRDTQTWGEITPVYIYDDDTPRRMHAVIPEAKIICCLRDQYDRAYSWYRFYLKHNPDIAATRYSFRRFLTYCNQVYAREGFYLDHLKKYLSLYPRNSILLLLYDDLIAQPKSFIQNIYNFLKVDFSFIPPSLTNIVNKAELEPPHRESERLFPSSLLPVSFPIHDKWGLLVRLNSMFDKRHLLLDKWDSLTGKHSDLISAQQRDEEIRKRMAKLFQGHNVELGKFLGRDLSHWNSGKSYQLEPPEAKSNAGEMV